MNNYLDYKFPLNDDIQSIPLSFDKKIEKSYFPLNLKKLSEEICPNFTPKDKEFSYIPLKYKNGISIIITSYKSQNYIKETLDSIEKQTWFEKNKNFEVLVGIDYCFETLEYLQTIMNTYSNLRVFMMKSNKGTYITTNTLMTIAKYDNLLRFDSDDIMYPFMIEELMNNSENIDLLRFKLENFGLSNEKKWATGQIMIKHDVFDWFGGYMPWPCSADAEFLFRIRHFVYEGTVEKILFRRRIHTSNLTVKGKTKMGSYLREMFTYYVENISRFSFNINKAVIFTIVNKYYEVFSNI